MGTTHRNLALFFGFFAVYIVTVLSIRLGEPLVCLPILGGYFCVFWFGVICGNTKVIEVSVHREGN
jgi:hypothetical protein